MGPTYDIGDILKEISVLRTAINSNWDHLQGGGDIEAPFVTNLVNSASALQNESGKLLYAIGAYVKTIPTN